jgi:glyoxylase-like metal-dependent hydrolase (beta-lactamase superfamily II)
MRDTDDCYELFAIAYARVDRNAADNFVGGDPHNAPMPLNYYVWLARNARHTVVIDTGFDQAAADQRQRTMLKPVAEGLAALGVTPQAVDDVIITHMHYDHAGNGDLFAGARYHLQDAEMSYATGRCMCDAHQRVAYEASDVKAMIDRVYTDRVCFHEGDVSPLPGISLHKIGGHSRGLQCVTVKTQRGPVVLASDASHHYAHLRERRIFPIVDDHDSVLAGYDRLQQLAPSSQHIIPGHDPLVTKLYPAHSTATEGWIVRLDQAPAGPDPLRKEIS